MTLHENKQHYKEVCKIGQGADCCKYLPKTETATSEQGSRTEWTDAIEFLNVLLKEGGSKSQKAEWKDAIEFLKVLLQE